MGLMTKIRAADDGTRSLSSARGVPTLESVSPELADLKRRRELLAREMVTGRAKLVAAAEAYRAAGAEAPRKAADQTDQRRQMAELLGDEPLPAPAGPPPDPAARLQLMSEALSEIDRRIAIAQLRASALVVPTIADDYRKIVSNLVDRLLALRDAQVAYENFVEALNREQIAWSVLGPMPVDGMIGGPLNPNGEVARYLRDGVRHGLIPQKAIPEELR